MEHVNAYCLPCCEKELSGADGLCYEYNAGLSGTGSLDFINHCFAMSLKLKNRIVLHSSEFKNVIQMLLLTA
jgi:hypothetical protein